jgi:hypothetical protein
MDPAPMDPLAFPVPSSGLRCSLFLGGDDERDGDSCDVTIRRCMVVGYRWLICEEEEEKRRVSITVGSFSPFQQSVMDCVYRVL